MTDGVGCSVVCTRPKSSTAPGYSPDTVLFNHDTIFKAIDPELTDIWTSVQPSLVFEAGEDGLEDMKHKTQVLILHIMFICYLCCDF